MSSSDLDVKKKAIFCSLGWPDIPELKTYSISIIDLGMSYLRSLSRGGNLIELYED